MTTVFITYNPKSEIEEALAYRLQTIALLYYGIEVYLPYRTYKGLTDGTTDRITTSDHFVYFHSTDKICKIVREEIDYAKKVRTKIHIHSKDNFIVPNESPLKFLSIIGFGLLNLAMVQNPLTNRKR